jgi:hypothetical protein
MDHGPTPFHDHDRASTVSSSSTPYSRSNSTSQIFEETSFFNQLSSNDSLSRGHQRMEIVNNDRGAFQPSPFAQPRGVYGLGFMDQTPFYSGGNNDVRDDDDDEDEDGVHTDKDIDGGTQDESGPLSERIKQQLHLEDELAFLPSGGTSASGVFPRIAESGYQRRTASGNNMPFQLDDELASLGTRALEEFLGHEGGDEEDDHKVRFKDVEPSRLRNLNRDGKQVLLTMFMFLSIAVGECSRINIGSSLGELSSKIRASPERSAANSRKSSAQNSVGSSFSDLSG